jgi:signal transduction histidine kinase
MPSDVSHARRVLIVEDNPADAELIEDLLSEGVAHVYRLERVGTLAVAVARLSDLEADAVLLDLRLPDGVGVECVSAVRARAQRVPIVVLTGLENEELALACIAAGAQDYISKHEMRGQNLDRAIGYAMARVREMTERQRADALHAQLAAIVEAASDAIIVVNRAGAVRYQNRSALALLSGGPDEVVRHVLSAGKGGGTIELTLQRQEDSRVCELRIREVEWQGEAAFVASLRDVTLLRKLDERLLQAQRMEAIGCLTGGIAHDFNNLLSIIMGSLELAVPGEPDCAELIQDALEAAARGGSLTRSLLAFARRQSLEPKQLVVNDVIADIVRLLRRTLGQNIAIGLHMDPDSWPIFVDPVQLEACVFNLANNARDAMPRGGKLTIRLRNCKAGEGTGRDEASLSGDHVLLEVADTGTGMPPAVVRRIFEPFFTTKDQGRGTGLGLSMVFGFVRQSGGHIVVDSEQGKGSVFRLFFPREAIRGEAEADQQAEQLPLGRGQVVLVVDDDPHLRRLAMLHLGELDYRAISAADAAEALMLLDQEAVDLLLTDIVMPGKEDGVELAKQVLWRWPKLKVVLTSGFAGQGLDGRLGPLAGALRFLNKPYRQRELAQVIRRALEAP